MLNETTKQGKSESASNDQHHEDMNRSSRSHRRNRHRDRTGNSRSSNSKNNSSLMITHRAADETALNATDLTPSKDECSHPLERSDSAPSLDTLDDEMTTTKTPSSSRCSKYRTVVLSGILFWVIQILLAVSLKKFGYIEKDLNDIVAMGVPNLQQFESSFGWPNFNDSTYWSLFNDSMKMGHIMQERQRPGFQLAQKGASGQYPVVMIPGFVTSGLEMWGGRECARKYFRQRMWGGVNSARLLFMERDCILQHLALDPYTGSDPDGIRLRAAQGFEAADYFMANYWVWGKILENLADVGYDGSTMFMASYDWRLAFPILEERDGYLTKLKYQIEAFHSTTGKKVVLTSHSLGGILVHYFFAWVTTSKKEGGGGGGKTWVDDHIHAYVNIAGAQLGVAKAAPALFSGEFRETIFVGTAGNVVEQLLGRKIRKKLWNTWGSLWAMLPKGGDAIWGVGADFRNDDFPITSTDPSTTASNEIEVDASESSNVDDHTQLTPLLVMANENENRSKPTSASIDNEFICPTEDGGLLLEEMANDNYCTSALLDNFAARSMHTVSQMVDFLLQWGDGLGSHLSSPKLHSFNRNEKDSSKTWHDITRTPLPHAPNMKIYCLYGVGIESERAYYYKRNTEVDSAFASDNDTYDHSRQRDLPYVIDTSVNDPDRHTVNGVTYVDGDGSVPLLSLGYMCNDAWRRESSGLNPSNIQVITREYKHRQEFSVDDPMRAGPYSADHVDILGNVDMMEDLMKIVTDQDLDEVQDRVVSDIHSIAKRINEHPQGGLYKTEASKWRQAVREFGRRFSRRR